MLVDDDDDAHLLFTRACRRSGLTQPLHVYSSGEDVLPHLERCAAGDEPWPYVVFLDIKMAGMSGFDVLVWMREHQMLARTVVAMVSSSEDPADVSRAYHLGAHIYLGKMPPPEKIAEVVDSAIRLAGG